LRDEPEYPEQFSGDTLGLSMSVRRRCGDCAIVVRHTWDRPTAPLGEAGGARGGKGAIVAVLSSERLASRIVDHTVQQGSCLFAGSGVGRRAGLPLWPEYLEHLVSVAENYETETAALIRKRVATGHYLEAAELYKECIEIPEGVKYRELAAPFRSPPDYSPDRLRILMVLPFSAVITTNYDRSLHDAYQLLLRDQQQSGLSLTAPQHVELGDLSMRHAVYWTQFYIARIHGRAEIPETMVVDRNDYRRTQDDACYLDFLLHVLKSYRCLFMGYSFVDPAINRVLEVMRDRLPAPYLQRHLAVLPSDSDARLRTQLAGYNIEVVEYDPADEHKVLWDSIYAAQREIRTSPRSAPDKVEPIPGLKRFVASAYARFRMGGKVEPLRGIVVEGVVAQAIMDSGSAGTTRADLIRTVKRYLSLSDAELGGLVTRAVDGLSAEGVCTADGSKILAEMNSQGAYDAVLKTLVSGAANRLKMREGVEADSRLRGAIGEVIERLLLVRGWDLGAHLAGGKPSSAFDAWSQIEAVLRSIAGDVSARESKALANAIFDVFRHPEDKEADLLADMGRISFALELVLNHARWTVVKPALLAATVYLDANVLMPAIVQGHPYGPVYADTISRMTGAAAAAGETTRILTATAFLDEIVAHRALAIAQVHDQGLEDPNTLRRHILMWGADRTNVYLGAYASWVGRTAEPVRFEQFLAEVAPYGSEDSLAEYLLGQGVRTVVLSFRSGEERDCYAEVRRALHRAYEDFAESEPYYEPKAKVLIDHEAMQLARLMLDMQAGRKPLFVTADRRLMGLCRGPILGTCADAMVSHLGFVQLVDLLLGVKTDKRALGRLMWSVGFSDERTAIRNYLIDLALQHYDDARAMAMWEVVDVIADEATEAAEVQGVTMFPTREEDKARTAAFLDRFEQDYYKNMAEVVRKREAQRDQV